MVFFSDFLSFLLYNNVIITYDTKGLDPSGLGLGLLWRKVDGVHGLKRAFSGEFCNIWLKSNTYWITQ